MELLVSKSEDIPGGDLTKLSSFNNFCQALLRSISSFSMLAVVKTA